MIDTNMVYEIKGEELVPLEKYWGAIPKIEMLNPNKVFFYNKIVLSYYMYSSPRNCNQLYFF